MTTLLPLTKKSEGHSYALDEILIESLRENPCWYEMADRNYQDTRRVEANMWKRIVDDMRNKFGPAAPQDAGEYD